MNSTTTKQTLSQAPILAQGDVDEARITRAVTLAKCIRCGFEWMPRKATPARCAGCHSPFWNVPRAQQLPGKPAPTRLCKPRDKAFTGNYDPRRVSQNPHLRKKKEDS